MATHKTLLAQLMSERNLSQDDVEIKFEQTSEALEKKAVSVSSRQLSRWITGTGGFPRPVARRVLEELFGHPINQLLAPPREVGVPAAVNYGSHNADGPSLSSSESQAAKSLLKATASRARDFGLVVGSAAMSQEVTEQLYEDIRRLGSMYPRVPLTGILDDIVSAQDSVYGLLEARRSPRQSRELYFLAGISGGMLAKASHDLAEPHAALTHARTAFLCAEQADHPGLMAWVRSLQALIAYWAGRPAESARYASHAKDLAATGVGSALLWANLSEARALASSGDRNTARKILAESEDLRTGIAPDELDEIGGLFTFGPIRQLYYAGDALSWVAEDATEAAEYSARAVSGYSDNEGAEWAFGDQAGAHANLAIARLSLGEPEGAREALSPLLALPPAQRMNGIVLSAQRVGRALAHSPQGRHQNDLRDEIEAFCRLPLTALSK